MFAGYLAERVWVEADGVRLRGTVQGSGVEVDIRQGLTKPPQPQRYQHARRMERDELGSEMQGPGGRDPCVVLEIEEIGTG